MIKQQLNIKNKLGLHARATVKLINVANKYQSEVFIEYQGREVNAKSILCVMALGVVCGSVITLTTDGADEEAAMLDLTNLIHNKFGEAE